jgi:hypothetical protein
MKEEVGGGEGGRWKVGCSYGVALYQCGGLFRQPGVHVEIIAEVQGEES